MMVPASVEPLAPPTERRGHRNDNRLIERGQQDAQDNAGNDAHDVCVRVRRRCLERGIGGRT